MGNRKAGETGEVQNNNQKAKEERDRARGRKADRPQRGDKDSNNRNDKNDKMGS